MGGTILVVDDHAATLAGVLESLAHAGYDTRGVSTFQAATQVLQETEPDLLIADVRLGDQNGIGLMISGRARHPGLQMIVVTGYPDPVLERDARMQGASAFLIKPLAPDQLLNAVEETLRASGRHRRHFRKRIMAAVLATINQRPVSIVDVSYDGAKLQVHDWEHADLPDVMELSLAASSLTVTASKVWTRRVDDTLLLGIVVQEADTHAADAWHREVDRLFHNGGASSVRLH